MSRDGVIYIATGEIYLRAARQSAESVRRHMPGVEIDLFTDADDIPAGVFDRVHVIENPHKRSKVDCVGKSRFERTLYLDSDTRVVADISELFDILDRFDIAGTHAHARERKATNLVWRQKIPEAFPQVNGGVLLYRDCEVVRSLLAEWSRAYVEAGFSKDQVSLRELLWLSDARLFILPPEYNVRYEKYETVWDAWEAQPKILHYARFHEPDGDVAAGRKRKTLARRFKALLGR